MKQEDQERIAHCTKDLVEQLGTNIEAFNSLLDRLISAHVLPSKTADGTRANPRQSPEQNHQRVRKFLSWLQKCNKWNCYQAFKDALQTEGLGMLVDLLDSYTPPFRDPEVR